MDKPHYLFTLNSEWLDDLSKRDKNIIHTYSTILKYLDIPISTLPNYVFEDISMFKKNGVFSNIDHTITVCGRIYLQYLLTCPYHNESLLARQQFIFDYSNNYDIVNKIQGCKNIDNDILWFIHKLEDDEKQYLDILLFTHKYTSFLNQYLYIITILNIFKLWLVPLQLVISPILILVAPYIIIRYYVKLKISVTHYIKLLKFLFYDIKKLNIIHGKKRVWTM